MAFLAPEKGHSTEMKKGTCENGNGESVEGKGQLSYLNRGIYQMLKGAF